MRVLWLVNIAMPPVRAEQGLPPLSYGGWLPAMLDALTSQSRDVRVVCATRAWPAPGPFEHAGVEYVTVPRKPVEGRWRGILSNWSTREDEAALEEQMRRLIDAAAPNLIHVHGTEQAHALAVARVAGATPVLVTLQGPQVEYVHHRYGTLPVADVLRDIASLEFVKGRGLAQARRRVKRQAARERRLLATAAHVSGRTDWDRRVALGANPDVRYWHIDEVLREPFYHAAWRGPAGDEPTLVAVTRASPMKGIDVLLKAYALIRRQRPCRLVVIGQIQSTPLWPSLRRLESRLGLTGLVEWAGEREAGEVAELFSACSASLCASHIENSPNSVCEAMLLGVPVIASDAGGIPTLITSEEDGLLFPAGDHEALAGAVLRVLGDDALARRLGSSARQVAMVRHDPASVGRRMHDVYASLVSGAPDANAGGRPGQA